MSLIITDAQVNEQNISDSISIVNEKKINWASMINESFFVDEACEHFSGKFMEFCKARIPSRNVLIRENDKTWFTSEIRYNIR